MLNESLAKAMRASLLFFRLMAWKALCMESLWEMDGIRWNVKQSQFDEDHFRSNVENFETFHELFMSQLALSRGTPFLCAGALGIFFLYESCG